MKRISRQEEFFTQAENLTQLDSTTSKGAQPKWRYIEKDLFIKQDYNGAESLSEWVVYNILDKCSNLRKERIVPYYLCLVDGVKGCYSKDFKRDEDEITLTDLFELHGMSIERSFASKTPEERLAVIQDLIVKYAGRDFNYELRLMFAVDAFFLNEDRHTSNISILEDDIGQIRMSPIFDNGLALLARKKEYPISTPLSKNIEKAKPVLLSSKFRKHIELYTYEPFLYKDKIEKFLEEYKEDLGRVYSILKYQLNQSHLQKLFIKSRNTLATSSIFSK